jgi:hypothetical protein
LNIEEGDHNAVLFSNIDFNFTFADIYKLNNVTGFSYEASFNRFDIDEKTVRIIPGESLHVVLYPKIKFTGNFRIEVQTVTVDDGSSLSTTSIILIAVAAVVFVLLSAGIIMYCVII